MNKIYESLMVRVEPWLIEDFNPHLNQRDSNKPKKERRQKKAAINRKKKKERKKS